MHLAAVVRIAWLVARYSKLFISLLFFVPTCILNAHSQLCSKLLCPLFNILFCCHAYYANLRSFEFLNNKSCIVFLDVSWLDKFRYLSVYFQCRKNIWAFLGLLCKVQCAFYCKYIFSKFNIQNNVNLLKLSTFLLS